MLFKFALLLTLLNIVASLDLYPFGNSQNDSSFHVQHSGATLRLTKPMELFSTSTSNIYIGNHGVLSINPKINERRIKVPSTQKLLAVYNMEYITTYPGSEHVLTYYREAFDDYTLNRATGDVQKFTKDSFEARHTVIVTWYSLFEESKNNNTFQIVLASNGSTTYGIASYDRLDSSNAISGYFDAYCHVRHFSSPSFSLQLNRTSNINDTGRHVMLLNDKSECSYNTFYTHASRNNLQNGESKQLNLSKSIPLFNSNKDVLYIHKNGYISTSDEEFQLSGIISPYFQDFTMDNAGSSVHYIESFEKKLLEIATNDIRGFSFDFQTFTANHLVIVSYFNMVADKDKEHTFQMVLVSDGIITFFIAIYFKLEYQSSYTGYQDKNKCVSELISEFPTSMNLVHGSNTGTTGKYIFLLTPANCQSQLFYPESSSGSPIQTMGAENKQTGFLTHDLFVISSPIPFPRRQMKRIFLTERGIISAGGADSGTYLASEVIYPVVAVYGIKVNLHHVNYTESSSIELLSQANKDIERFSGHTFNATRIFLFTYWNIDTLFLTMSRNSFQLVLATDEKVTYAILNYHRLDGMDANVGFAAATCDYERFILRRNSRLLVHTSNVGVKGRHVLLLTDKCYKSAMYPFGTNQGDMEISSSTKNTIINLPDAMPVFSGKHKKLYVNNVGLLSNEPIRVEHHISLPFRENIIAIYNNHIGKGSYFYRSTTDKDILVVATRDVQHEVNKTFNATRAVVISFHYDVDNTKGKKNIFQLVLVTDDWSTYGIFIYDRLDGNEAGTSGYTIKGCSWQLIREEQNMFEMAIRRDLSNTGVIGRHVRLVNSRKCTGPTTFYQYGDHVNHKVASELEKTPVQTIKLEQPIFIFGESTKSLNLVRHGLISIGSKVTSSNPIILKRYRFIAPYVAQNGFHPFYGGNIYYGSYYGTNDFLDEVAADINEHTKLNFAPNVAFILTYAAVANLFQRYAKSTFQVILASDGMETYAVMNFLRIDKTNGQTGFNIPSCWKTMFRKWTHEELMQTSNTGNMGQHVFKLECPEPKLTTTTTTAETATNLESTTWKVTSTSTPSSPYYTTRSLQNSNTTTSDGSSHRNIMIVIIFNLLVHNAILKTITLEKG